MKTVKAFSLLFALVLIYSCKQAAEPAPEPKPQPAPAKYVPTTISEQAQKYLQENEPQELNVAAGWDSARAAYNKTLLEQTTKIKDELQPRLSSLLVEGVNCHIIFPKNYNEKKDINNALLFFHGGKFTFGEGENALGTAIRICDATNLRGFVIDYPLAPENTATAMLEACFKVYEGTVKVFNPAKVAVIAEEAGAALALSVLKRAQEKGMPMPAKLCLLSPWIDLSKTGDTYYTLENFSPDYDYAKNLESCAKAYAGKSDLESPLVSPIYYEYQSGFPTTLIQTGTRDIFLSNSARLQQKLTAQGVNVHLSVSEGMWVGFQSEGLPEAKQAIREIQRFLQ